MWETDTQRCFMICLMSLKKTVMAWKYRSLQCCLNSANVATYPYNVVSNTMTAHMFVW